VAILESLKSTRVILVDGGEGSCNPVYVDDVVSAMLLAATQKAAVGEAFLISGERAITWREFYQAYERMLGSSSNVSAVSMSAEEALRYYNQQEKGRGLLREAITVLRDDYDIRERILTTPEVRFVRKMARLLLPRPLWEAAKERFMGQSKASTTQTPSAVPDGRPMPAVPPPMIRFYAAKGRVRIDKAKKLLGYEPDFDLRAGMQRTEQWARWADLLGRLR
jgi:nucleoside-diphosphate-sugar epimerase